MRSVGQRLVSKAKVLFAPLSIGIAIAAAGTSASAAAATPDAPEARCAAMARHDFSDLPDGPAQILSAQPFPAAKGMPAYCDIKGYSWRSIQFRVLIPMSGWNEKMLVAGTGGQAGSLFLGDPSTYYVGDALAKGYALVFSDTGHISSGGDSKWAWNNEAAMIDHAFRASHVAGAVGKAVIAAYSGRKPAKSYFHGCSNGGREALMMAQRFPWDYDGIIAGAPSQAYGRLFMHMAWFNDLLRDQGPNGITPAIAKTLHAAVLDQCDGLDGNKDGVLDDPRQCKVDFSRIQCKNGVTEACLTQHQVGIARKLYEGPRSDDGTQLAMSSIVPGSELNWQRWRLGSTSENPTELAARADLIDGYPREVFRYLMTAPGRGPSFDPKISEMEQYRKAMGYMDTLLSAMDPDLRPYRDAGGKLLIYWGWNDSLGGTLQGVDYFEAVQRVMGGDSATAPFTRMFMVPGMGHCSGGEGPWKIDYLTALDNWVTRNKEPDALTGTHPADETGPDFTRQIPRYRTSR